MKITDEKRRNLILNGNMWKVVISICAPLFIYNFFNSLYNLVDSIFANEISTDSVSSVAALGQIKNLLSSFGAGLAAGGAILVARCFGAGEYTKARKYANVLVTLVSVIVALLAVVCIPLSYTICMASGISKAQAAASTGYFIIQIVELLFIAYNNVFIALQKSKGNTKSIFYLNFVTMGVKLLLNVIFIYLMHVDSILWIGVATLISQITLFVILGVMVLRKNNIFRISVKEFSLSWQYVKPILILSIPIFLGKFVFSFGKVAVNSIFGSRYLEILKSQIDISDPLAVASAEASAGLVVGALAVSNNINGIVTNPINSFEETESTIISQNLGNKNLKRALDCFLKGFILSTILGFVAWILIRFVFQSALIGLYSQDQNPAQAEEFMNYVKIIHNYDSWSIPSLAINAGVLGVLYGFGKTKLTMFINIARAFVFRIPILVLLLYCFPELGVECAGLSMGISNVCIALMSIICLIIFLIQIKKKGYQGMVLETTKESQTSQEKEKTNQIIVTEEKEKHMENFLKRKVIYEGRVLRLELDQVECENGQYAYREIVRHNGGAAILCIANNKVLLIKQYRYAYDEVLYEIPAGKLEKDEEPLSAAKREFEEETGNRALDISYLTTIYPTCGYSNEKIHLFLVTNFEPSEQHLDEDEVVEPMWIELEQILEMIQKGIIKDAKTICAIQAYLMNINKIQL